MALSDLWTSADSAGGWGGVASGLLGLYGGMQGVNTANHVNSQVGGLLQQQQALAAQQQQALQQQQQAARDAYTAAQGNVNSQNAGLNNDISTMTANLSALSDPNSPYMQQARQAIERKDAAAGRRSQWGERETQLAGQLADYVGKYSPAMQSAITNARNQINQNNLGLAGIFSGMNNTANNGAGNLMNSLSGAATSANTTGRAAQQSATNNMTSLLGGGIRAGASLAQMLFGGGGGGSDAGIWGNMFNSGSGTSGFGDGSLWGNSFQPMSDYGSSTSNLGGYGYGNLPAGDYFGGGGFGGVPTAWDGGGLNDSSLWD